MLPKNVLPSKETDSPITIDVSRQDALRQLVPHMPLLTSYHAKWDGLILAYHLQPAHATPDSVLNHHMVSILTQGPIRIEQSVDNLHCKGMVESGDITIIPAGSIHKSCWDRETEFIVLLLDPAYFNQIVAKSIDPTWIQLEPRQAMRDPLIEQIGWSLKGELEESGTGSRLYVDSMTTTLCAHLIRKYTTRTLPLHKPMNSLPRRSLRKALDYVNGHLDQDLKLAEIAKAAGMSQFYFARLFKQSMGITPYRYVVRQRVELAKQLLRQRKLPIAIIAHQCGFANQSHLIKHFRRCTGVTPKVYQDQ